MFCDKVVINELFLAIRPGGVMDKLILIYGKATVISVVPS